MIEEFFKQFLDTWFYQKDTQELGKFFDKNSCVIFTTSGQKFNGKESIVKALHQRIQNSCGYYLNDVEMVHPNKELYSVFGDCVLKYQGTTKTSMVRMNAIILEKEKHFSILQLQFSLLYDALHEIDPQQQKMEILYQDMLENRRRLDTAITHCGLSIWDYDIQTKCIYQKDNSQNMHGLTNTVEDVPDSLIKSGYIHPESALAFKEMYQKLAQGIEKIEGIFQVRTNDQKEYWWEKITYINEFDENHQPIKALGFSTNVTQRVNAQQEIRRMELQKQLLEQKTLMNMIVDLTADHVINIDMLRFDANQQAIHNLKDIQELLLGHCVNVDQKEQVKAIVSLKNLENQYALGESDGSYDFLYMNIDKVLLWAQFSYHLNKNMENGHFILNGYVENIDERKKREIELKSHAELDGLTQVYNRKTFQMLSENILATHLENKHIVFGVVDIDDFKSINDQYGHYYGDSVLQKVAEALKTIFAEQGFIGRLGGDEFVFTFVDSTKFSSLHKQLNDLFLTLHTPDTCITIPVNISVGIAVAPWDGNTFDVLYKKADIALYQVKQQNKNNWHIYKESTDGIYHQNKK